MKFGDQCTKEHIREERNPSSKLLLSSGALQSASDVQKFLLALKRAVKVNLICESVSLKLFDVSRLEEEESFICSRRNKLRKEITGPCCSAGLLIKRRKKQQVLTVIVKEKINEIS